MLVIVVGGQTKDVGKTTLVCNIVSAFRERAWTAVKISDHRHEVSGCRLLAEGTGWSILEQRSLDDASDTVRYLQAGAARALLVQADEKATREAVASLPPFLSGNAIVESNRAREFLSPDLFLLVVDAERDFKPSARAQLERADVLIYRGELRSKFDKPSFSASEEGLDSRLVSLIRARIMGNPLTEPR